MQRSRRHSTHFIVWIHLYTLICTAQLYLHPPFDECAHSTIRIRSERWVHLWRYAFTVIFSMTATEFRLPLMGYFVHTHNQPFTHLNRIQEWNVHFDSFLLCNKKMFISSFQFFSFVRKKYILNYILQLIIVLCCCVCSLNYRISSLMKILRKATTLLLNNVAYLIWKDL